MDTKAFMIPTLTITAVSLFKIADNMATPCSVKAYGSVLLPPLDFFVVTICDFKLTFSDSTISDFKFANSTGVI